MENRFHILPTAVWVILILASCIFVVDQNFRREDDPFDALDREVVVFWHFWGGADRDVVDDVVLRFNESQSKFLVRAIAMPGNNLNSKLFLSIAGGDPPDIVNQDDPIIADWASRHAIVGIDEIATPEEIESVQAWLLPSARRLATYNNRLMAIPNGLDIRALYFNKTVLDQYGLEPPRTIADLDKIAMTISPPGAEDRDVYAFIPDSRRLWSWAYVFGGQFIDGNQNATVDHPRNVDALQWMAKFSDWYGPDRIAAFRQGDQSLPGKTFPLLPVDDRSIQGRYILIQDGQWRTRDIAAFLARRQQKEIPAPEFGVCPLPVPPAGRTDAGWVNGNFFVIPRGARNPRGALAFARFWIGIDDPGSAAATCAAGGWIPVGESVVQHATFQRHLENNPLFRPFVELAGSQNQFPYPQVPGAPFFKRTVDAGVQKFLGSKRNQSAETELKEVNRQVEHHLQAIKREFQHE